MVRQIKNIGIIPIISLVIALVSASFSGVLLYVSYEHNRFNETNDSLAMLYSRLIDYRTWALDLKEDNKEKAIRYYHEATKGFKEAEKELRGKNIDLAKQWIYEACDELEAGKRAIEYSGDIPPPMLPRPPSR